MLCPLLKSALVQVDENLGGFQCTTTTDHHMLYHHRGWHRSYQVNNPLDVAPARSQKTWHCVGQSRGELRAGVRHHTARWRRGRRAEVGLVYYRIVWNDMILLNDKENDLCQLVWVSWFWGPVIHPVISSWLLPNVCHPPTAGQWSKTSQQEPRH